MYASGSRCGSEILEDLSFKTIRPHVPGYLYQHPPRVCGPKTCRSVPGHFRKISSLDCRTSSPNLCVRICAWRSFGATPAKPLPWQQECFGAYAPGSCIAPPVQDFSANILASNYSKTTCARFFSQPVRHDPWGLSCETLNLGRWSYVKALPVFQSGGAGSCAVSFLAMYRGGCWQGLWCLIFKNTCICSYASNLKKTKKNKNPEQGTKLTARRL